jgi:hypothetical protein
VSAKKGLLLAVAFMIVAGCLYIVVTAIVFISITLLGA